MSRKTRQSARGSGDASKVAPEEPRSQEPQERPAQSRQHSRALILGALAAGGVFQLNGWQVQAHGNRSSHTATVLSAVAFTPRDYTLIRQVFTAPNLSETRQLVDLNEQLRSASSARLAGPQMSKLTATRQELEDKLRLRTTTHRSLELLRQGDTAGAVAAIEGEGWTERVLGEYLWALLDTAYLGRKGDAFTAEHMKEFTALSKAAMAYSEKVLKSLPAGPLSAQDRATKDRIAEIYHNIASFTLPDDGAASSEDLRLGRDAAARALTLRQQLQQKPETMRAHWMLGKHELRAGENEKARKSFDTALRMATELNDQAGIAWSKAYLAKVSNPGTARKLLADAGRIAAKGGNDVSLQFLLAEQGGRK